MAVNMYIKFEGPVVDGGATAKGHEGQIEVLSWSHGFTQPTSPTRSAAGSGTVEKCHHGAFSFTKYTDPATDDLLKICWSGQHVDKVTLTCYRSSGDTGGSQMGIPYLKVEMESVIVSNLSISGSAGDIPVENVSLDYAKVTYTYNMADMKEGTVGAIQAVSHDLMTNSVA